MQVKVSIDSINVDLGINNTPNVKVLMLKGEKGDVGYPTDEQVKEMVDEWLDEHPEATTTVEDGSISIPKLASDVIAELDNKANVSGEYENLTAGTAEQIASSEVENDKVPYLFRQTGATNGNRSKVKAIVGGTVAWNQMLPAMGAGWSASSGLSVTYSNGVATFTANAQYNGINRSVSVIENHIYYMGFASKPTTANTAFRINIGIAGLTMATPFNTNSAGIWNDLKAIKKANVSGSGAMYFQDTRASGWDEIAMKEPQFIDLTVALGPTIADYIYSLETTTAGAGVAFFKKLFPKPYYAYNAGELISVKTSGHITTGFNQWDEQWEVGGFYTASGLPWATTDRIRSKNYIPVLPNATYYIKVPNGSNTTVLFYDSNYNFIEGSAAAKYNTTFITPANAAFMKFNTGSVYGTTYKNDICINLHWDGERDGEYEPYVQHTYPLDDVDLRGIFKLDDNNKLYCDGDTYEPDGTVTRKYREVTYVGAASENWSLQSINSYNIANFYIVPPAPNINSINGGIVSNRFLKQTTLISVTETEGLYLSSNTIYVRIQSSKASTVAELKTWLSNNNLTIGYELVTPTTETADPYTEVQVVDPWGTEEFVDERAVPIPVGHDTDYMSDLRKKLEEAPDSPTEDGSYVMKRSGGKNTYAKIPSPPAANGTYKLTATVSGGTTTYSWEA